MPRILHRLGRAIHRAGKLVRDSCAGQCCGACSRVYVFNACCSGISPVYVCSDATCQGTPIAQVFRIIVGTMCYSRAPDSQTIATSPTMQLTDGADIDACDHGGCTSPECVDYCGIRFIPGEICPGQTYSGPPVFVYVGPGQSCGVLNISGVCFKFDPSNTIPQSQVPQGATLIGSAALEGTQNPRCCACVPACGETVQTVSECSGAGPTQVERRCCCTQRRDVTINFYSEVDYNPTISNPIRRTITGTALVQYNDQGIPYNTVGGMASVTETYIGGSTQTFDVPFTPAGGCLPVPLDPYLGVFRPFSWVLDCAFFSDDGANTAQTLTNIVRTCTNGLHSGTWSLRRNAGIPGDPLSGQVLAEGTYTSSIAVVFFGRCSGGCGGTAGRSDVIVARGSAGCANCGDKGTGGATI